MINGFYAEDDHEALPSGGFNLFSAANTADFSALTKLPMVKLNVTQSIEVQGDKYQVHLRVENPTNQLAFFIQLALTKGHNGEEVLPIFWEDNYLSLLPHESREITGTFAAGDMGKTLTVVEVGGWNIQTDYRCTDLVTSKNVVKSGESFTVTANIANTFLDGSRVALLVDGQSINTQWAYARGKNSDEITFMMNLSEPGKHKLTIANQSITVVLE